MATFSSEPTFVTAPIAQSQTGSNDYNWADAKTFPVSGSTMGSPVVVGPVFAVTGASPWDGAQNLVRTLKYNDPRQVIAPAETASTITPYAWKGTQKTTIVEVPAPTRYVLTGYVVATRQYITWTSTDMYAPPPSGETVVGLRVLGIAK